jgi:hypothetical protein
LILKLLLLTGLESEFLKLVKNSKKECKVCLAERQYIQYEVCGLLLYTKLKCLSVRKKQEHELILLEVGSTCPGSGKMGVSSFLTGPW